MWEKIELPIIEGPVKGFTFPSGDVMLVLTPKGLVRVGLCPVEVMLVVNSEELNTLYHSQAAKLEWEGEQHLVYDADGGDITLCDHPQGDRLEFDPDDGVLLVIDSQQFTPNSAEWVVRQRIESIQLPHNSWPHGNTWMFAGFSHDYRWLVAGSPAGVQVFRYVPSPIT